MWKTEMGLAAMTLFDSMLEGLNFIFFLLTKQMWTVVLMAVVAVGWNFCLLMFLRIYGPRLYPYLTTNWKFIWPGEGPR